MISKSQKKRLDNRLKEAIIEECPWCGHLPQVYKQEDDPIYDFMCSNEYCKVIVCIHACDIDSAIRIWNKRYRVGYIT